MYALYDAYGFEHEQIAALFVAGFGSSMVFGTVAGSLADTLGRKRAALGYVVVYVLSCVTKHWRSYGVLMVGRILGGIATSLLFSVFDSWLVAEHTARGFEPQWLSSTFANAQAGNSLVAIAAGVLGEWSAGLSPMRVLVAGGAASAEADAGGPDGAIMVGGYCTPFDLAAAVLLVGGVAIVLTWPENYGEQSATGGSYESAVDAFAKGFGAIAKDRRVALVGAVSSCFEGAMYAFVFEWTPAVTPPGGDKPPYGEIFSVMMICCMAGTRCFGILAAKQPPEKFARGLFALAAAALSVPVLLPGQPTLAFVGFLVFEFVVGAYFPAIGMLKGKIIPDAQRSTIYNLFRVPLNLIVLGVLLSHLNTTQVFTAVVALLASAAVLQSALYRATVSKAALDDSDHETEPFVAV